MVLWQGGWFHEEPLISRITYPLHKRFFVQKFFFFVYLMVLHTQHFENIFFLESEIKWTKYFVELIQD